MPEGIKVAAGIVAFFGVVLLSGTIERLHVRWRSAKRAKKRRRATEAAPIVIDCNPNGCDSPRILLQTMPTHSILLGSSRMSFWLRTSQDKPVQVCLVARDRESLGEAFRALISRDMPVADEIGDPAPGAFKVFKPN